MLQHLLILVCGRQVAHIALSRSWKLLVDESYETGYAAGVANSIRFDDRVRQGDANLASNQPDLRDLVSSRQVYEFIGHRNGQALAFRDRADLLLGLGHRAQAAEFYQRCAEIAREHKNCSLELKGLIGLHRCGRRVDPSRVESLLGEIEGSGYRRLAGAVLELFKDG